MHETLGRGRTAGRSGRVLTAALLPALVAGAGLVGGCGAGGGGAPKGADNALLYAQTFSLPNYSGIYQDEDLVLQFSANIKEDSINPDSVQLRTGASGGIAPFGTFVRGVFLVDNDSASAGYGHRVVIDPAGASENLINRVERTGSLVSLPDTVRLDLGYDEANVVGENGQRRVLFDKSRKSTVTFVPEIPTRAALDDAGFAPASTYTVAIPGYPSTNTLQNEAGSRSSTPATTSSRRASPRFPPRPPSASSAPRPRASPG